MKNILTMCIFIFCIGSAFASKDINPQHQMGVLMDQIATMPKSDRNSDAIKQKIEKVFVDVCLHGAQESAQQDLKSGKMDHEKMASILKMVKEKCSCVIQQPVVMDAFLAMADQYNNKNADTSEKVAADFQRKVSNAMTQCLKPRAVENHMQ